VRCYNHSDRDAIGICRACNKGLCTECAVDLGFALSCRGEHEQRVAATDAMVARAARVQDSAAWAKYAGPAFFGFCGIVMAYYGLTTSEMGGFLSLLGVAFLGLGAFLLVANRKAYRKTAPTPNKSLERTREK
jgi:D-arabinose 1-dehydrogenase-like Zn-dependent alcohol dehydrogenase